MLKIKRRFIQSLHKNDDTVKLIDSFAIIFKKTKFCHRNKNIILNNFYLNNFSQNFLKSKSQMSELISAEVKSAVSKWRWDWTIIRRSKFGGKKQFLVFR